MMILAGIALLLSAIPTLIFRRNLALYRVPAAVQVPLPAVSVLIPARNEEKNIRAAVESVLANRSVALEVVVLDDHSEDSTAAVAGELARLDGRVRLETAPSLPTGWCGKQHACYRLAALASNPVLCFMDADVRLSPDALARLCGYLESSGAALMSGFPRQETGTFLEKLLIPMIHFILLGFLPIGRMRASTQPAYAAGCGQLMLARRSDYLESGGHSVIRASLHDGLKLPRAFRVAGLRTDLCDATDLASCRMYSSASDVWRGLAKNATEGMAAPGRIIPFSLLLAGGQVLPFVLLLTVQGWAFALSLVAVLFAWYPRFAALVRFRQSLLGALLHPVGIILLLAIQWYALISTLLGRRTGWKGREYVSAS